MTVTDNSALTAKVNYVEISLRLRISGVGSWESAWGSANRPASRIDIPTLVEMSRRFATHIGWPTSVARTTSTQGGHHYNPRWESQVSCCYDWASAGRLSSKTRLRLNRYSMRIEFKSFSELLFQRRQNFFSVDFDESSLVRADVVDLNIRKAYFQIVVNLL